MSFWDIIDELSSDIQFPTKWHKFINTIYIFQLLLAIGSCYINENMMPRNNFKNDKKKKPSLMVRQIKIMFALQLILFYWEITFTNMYQKDPVTVQHHVFNMFITALMMYFPNTICGYSLLPYLFYSVQWVIGGGKSELLHTLHIISCFVYSVQSIYSFKVQETLPIFFPILYALKTAISYRKFCWKYNGTICPPSDAVLLLGSGDLRRSIMIFAFVLGFYSLTLVPFYLWCASKQRTKKSSISIMESIENLKYGDNRASKSE